MSINLRVAETPEDRLDVIRIQHAANASAQPLEYYSALRLRIPLRRTATWWLLVDGARPVSALLCYLLTLARGSARAAGFGIGGVATIPEARKQGFATRLCRTAMETSFEDGRRIGLLYSAIPPKTYERLGFSVLPASDFRCLDVAALAASGRQTDLEPIAPLDHLGRLTALRRASMRDDEWHVVRETESEWLRDLTINHEDVFLALPGFEGYVRIVDDPKELEVVELVAPDPEQAVEALRSVASIAAGLGRPCLRGWLRAEHCPRPHFADAGRARTLPMMSGIAAGDRGWFAACDYF